jgi:translation initiation factor 5A
VEEEPCKILSIQTSKPGKHGESKARLEVVGLFDGQKRSVVHPVTHKVRVPMIDKRKAQVLSVRGDTAQLMDLQTYETFDLPVPEDLAADAQPGSELLYMEAMGRRQLTRP